MTTELWVDKTTLRDSKVVNTVDQALQDQQIRVAIDHFALTANNVSYAVTGDSIGYWSFYPAEDNWGKVPVWGFADVIESRSDSIAVGERLYGFFPIASQATLTVGESTDSYFVEGSEHREHLPAAYNLYRRTTDAPDFHRDLEAERCLFFPLLMTGYFLYDYLQGNDYFGARQIIIGSASSKTAIGLAYFLSQTNTDKPTIIGVTSPRNSAFVSSLGFYDKVVSYGEETSIDPSVTTAYVDMSGDAPLTEKLHQHIADNMVDSCMVGFTHWEQLGQHAAELPGATPTFFFAPDHVVKRDAQWGKGVLSSKANEASAEAAKAMANLLQLEYIQGAAAAENIWRELLDNIIAPNRGIMVSLTD